MTDHLDDRSRGERFAEATWFKLVARLSMPLCTALVGLALYTFNDKMGTINEKLVALTSDLKAVRDGVIDVKTSDAVQNQRINDMERRLDANRHSIDRIEQKVFQ